MIVGQTLAHYHVEEQLGIGGMGVVYKATDTKLGRPVALKLLHESFSRDPERTARFDREARLLASLNHPNIAAIHGLEESGGAAFLVLEYVPGATLAERLANGPLPLRAALAVAVQVAAALEAAHERGIIHRDLKPANIKVTEEDTVKVLDFGLGKALELAPGTGETMTRDATMTGVVLGTAPYMSPEQACGKPLDARTDIWSFGCVLYEMLTGTRTFKGDTATEVIAGIVERDPDWTALTRVHVPGNIEQLLRRCLQKDPHCRLRSIGDARLEIEDTLGGRAPIGTGPAAARPRRGLVISAAVAGILVGGFAAVGFPWRPATATVSPSVVRFSIDLKPGQFFRPTWNGQIGFSPDGKLLAYAHREIGGSTARLYLRRLDDLDAHPMADLPLLSFHAFSPDGTQLLLLDPARQRVMKAALTGGPAVEVASADFAFRGDWAPDNYYYWTNQYFGPVVRTPIGGGKPEPVTELDLTREERTHRHAVVLPGGRAVMFTVSYGGAQSFDEARIDAFTLDTRQRKTLVEGGFAARYSPSGHIVYARGGNLYAVAFDVKRLEVTGSPAKVAEGVFMSTNSGSANFDVSSTGALAYVAGKDEGGQRTLVWVDRGGNANPLPLPPRAYVFPRIAPDGSRIAFEVEGVNHDLYSYEPERDVTTRMTTDGMSHAPVWTPDGKRLAFRSWKAGTMTMWWMPADRSGPEERLTVVGARQSVDSFSPDGRYAAFNQMALGTTGADVWVLPLIGDRQPVPFVRSKFQEGSARFSPDGKWVAYCTLEPGRAEVFVQPWPGPGPRIQVSSDGGTDPIWSRDGKELFYRNGDKMMAVAVSTMPTFKSLRPTVLWEDHYSHGMSSSCGPPGTTEANYSVSSDGQRFLMIKDADQDVVGTRIVVVLNFLEALQNRK